MAATIRLESGEYMFRVFSFFMVSCLIRLVTYDGGVGQKIKGDESAERIGIRTVIE